MYNSKPKIKTAEQYLELISKDFQFDKSHPDYSGFINIDPRSATELGNDYSQFAYTIAMNSDNYETIANKYGLTIESAFESELVIAELN